MEVQGIEVGVINESGYPLPEYQTLGSSGLDVRANIERPVLLKPLGRIIISNFIFNNLLFIFNSIKSFLESI